MPKQKSNKKSQIKTWIKEVNDDQYTFDGVAVYCQPCQKRIKIVEQKSHIVQHNKSPAHAKNVLLWEKKRTHQPSIVEAIEPKRNELAYKLTGAFLAANIPLYKLKNPAFKSFLEEFGGISVPDESTLRQTYIKVHFDEIQLDIIKKLENKPFWLSVDETKDACGRAMTNVILGEMSKEGARKGFLFCSRELDAVNNITIQQLVLNVLRKVCSTEEEINDKFLLYLTDGVGYMKKSGRALKMFYPNMVHVTCVAHAMHLVADEIRGNYEKVNKLITFGKQILLKASNRIKKWKEINPNTPLPPRPIFTRWGTWLEAVEYYSKYLLNFKYFIQKLKSEDSAAIRECKILLDDPELSSDIVIISSNYSFLIAHIKKLQDQSITLEDSTQLVESALENLMKAKGTRPTLILKKFIKILDKNEGLKQIKGIERILRGKTNEGINETLPKVPNLSPDKLSAFKFAPITSVEVERSFSRYKNIHTNNRRSLTKENIEMLLVCNCYYND